MGPLLLLLNFVFAAPVSSLFFPPSFQLIKLNLNESPWLLARTKNCGHNSGRIISKSLINVLRIRSADIQNIYAELITGLKVKAEGR